MTAAPQNGSGETPAAPLGITFILVVAELASTFVTTRLGFLGILLVVALAIAALVMGIICIVRKQVPLGVIAVVLAVLGPWLCYWIQWNMFTSELANQFRM